MGRPVVHFEIEGRDGENLRAFYTNLFDWDIEVDENNPAEYGLVQTDPKAVGIVGAVATVPHDPSATWNGRRRDQGYPGHVTIFVEVTDVESALAQAEALGGTRMQGPDPLGPGIEIGKLTDPEGHLIGVVTAPKETQR